MKSLKDKLVSENKESATFTLTVQDLDKILYSLAFTAGWGDEVNNYNYKDYKKLWYDLLEGVKKSFNENEIKDCFVEKWYDYELSHRGSCRHLD
jgi:hypothetical protein